MSTTFEVYPRHATVPSFQALLERATTRLHAHLAIHGIAARPVLRVSVRSNGTHESLERDLSSPATWAESEYAWFYVDDLAGGTDAYGERVSVDDLECWDDILRDHPPATARRTEMLECLAAGRYWRFRRSAGQPPIIALAYGILAAALAELTDGFIYSDDSAWDYPRFPARAEDFYRWYFDPEQALGSDYATWASRCLTALREG
ncbi:hypothetical protein [Pseudomonas sp. GD03944]|uniref:hypothetical protein n=1 Tax=Pseudomonas sp. GD03944 TaxID=2975409 RepID=UPI00244D4335|nr:hypothetical protein [Pseudomonas sp. GD03944]MDH1263292.1 hypothetical protein [Pseudomonas sp. GD03944]